MTIWLPKESLVKSIISLNGLILGSSKERCTPFLDKSQRQPQIIQPRKSCHRQVLRCFLNSCIQPFLSMRGNRGLKKSTSNQKHFNKFDLLFYRNQHKSTNWTQSQQKSSQYNSCPLLSYNHIQRGHNSFLNVKVLKESSALNRLPALHSYSASVFPVCLWQNANFN